MLSLRKISTLKLLSTGWLLVLTTAVVAGNDQNPWLREDTQANFSLRDRMVYGEKAQMERNAEALVLQEVAELQTAYSDLKHLHTETSIMGCHITWQQSYQSLPIYGSQVKLNIGKDDHVLSLFHKTVNTASWEVEIPKGKNWDSLLMAHHPFKGQLKTQPIIYYNGVKPAYAIKAIKRNFKQDVNKAVIYNADMEKLHEKELKLSYSLADTTVSGYVFLPDPLTTAKESYESPYVDNNDEDHPALNNERQQVDFKVNDPVNDTFYLEGPYAKIVDNSDPSTDTTISVDGAFYFTRSQSGFEDVNIYYHINNFRNYIASLGFDDLMNYSIPVDGHALSGQDQSQFSFRGNGKGNIKFGEGGIDDGEDADIVVHEYTHGISYNAAPGSHEGDVEAETIEEGLCDYLACSYSKNLSEYNWEKLFNWDGNETWNGRNCVTEKQYPQNFGTANKYTHADLWTGTFMNIRKAIGRETTDQLMLSALMSFSRNMSMRQAAKLFMQADTVINNKANSSDIQRKLGRQGLIEDWNSSIGDGHALQALKINKMVGKQEVTLKFSRKVQRLNYRILTINGKTMKQGNFTNVDQISLPIQNFAKGLYMISMSNEHGSRFVKFAKR